MFETERLSFRQFTALDLDDLIELRSDAEVVRFIGGAASQTPEFCRARLEFYQSCYAKFGFGMSAVMWRESGAMIGVAGLQPLGDTGEIELGYALAREFWNRGLASEIAVAWLEYGFNVAGLARIVAVAAAENAGSRRVMEKCGMKFEKIDFNNNVECAFYAIARGEFLQHNSRA